MRRFGISGTCSRSSRRGALIAALLAIMAGSGAGWAAGLESRPFTHQELEPVLLELEASGHERAFLQKVFYDSRLRKLDRVISFNVVNADSAAIYHQFTEPYAIRIAKRFKRRHPAKLRRIERRYHVPAEILVAVLLVETQFGRAHLPYRVLDVFTSLAVEDTPTAVIRHYRRLKPKHPSLSRKTVAERLQKKAAWARGQLIHLLSISLQGRVNLLELRGSYAGAFGMPQFLPSSFSHWAVDGDGNGRKDLDDLDDALASTANFLRAHGWRKDAKWLQQYRAVWEYNRSPHYVAAIFGIAFRLRAPPPKNIRPRLEAPRPSYKQRAARLNGHPSLQG